MGWPGYDLDVLGLLAAVLPIIWAVWQYIAIRRSENRQRRFETYHRLIKELVVGDLQAGPFVDQQVAVVYELKNFREYRRASTRILKGVRAGWVASELRNNAQVRLVEQIDETLEELESNFWLRWSRKQ